MSWIPEICSLLINECWTFVHINKKIDRFHDIRSWFLWPQGKSMRTVIEFLSVQFGDEYYLVNFYAFLHIWELKNNHYGFVMAVLLSACPSTCCPLQASNHCEPNLKIIYLGRKTRIIIFIPKHFPPCQVRYALILSFQVHRFDSCLRLSIFCLSSQF